MAFALSRSAVVFFGRQPQPQLEVDTATVDFGRVPTSQPVQHRFAMTNSGNAKLFIMETKTNCECIVAQLPRKVLEAGESMFLDVTFTPKKAGRRQQRVAVKTNDSQQPVTVLTMNATAYEPTRRVVEQEPADDDMSSFPRDAP